MRIKSIEVEGFKSFVDRQTIELDKPVAAVVGPNGCGKSNIVDAIRWAMGEQSVKALRGRRMEDIIFAGSESRPPAGVAEVTLTFDNADKTAPAEYARFDEIAITRKLFRENESHYFINKKRARLKDVTDIFLGTGVGKEAYSIVEQGTVGFIVSAKPEERRQIIEEAAGITRYRARRQEAENKLERTMENLLRVNDMTDELGRQRRSLERQAARAKKYQELRDELKSLELLLAARKILRLRAKIEELAASKAGETERKTALQARLASLDAAMTVREQALAGREETLRAAQADAHRLESEIKLDEQAANHRQSEIIRIAERKGGIEEERTALAEKSAKLRDEETALSAAKKELETGFAATRRNLETAESEQSVLNREISSLDAAISKGKDDLFKFAQTAVEIKNRTRYLDTLEEDAALRIRRNEKEREELEASLAAQKETLAKLDDELAALRETLTDEEKKAQIAERELGAAREAEAKAEKELAEARTAKTKISSMLSSLQEFDKRMEGAPDGLKSAIGAGFGDKKEVRTLGSRLNVEPKYERAVAALLGPAVNMLMLDESADAASAAAALTKAAKGRASAASLQTAKTAESLNAGAFGLSLQKASPSLSKIEAAGEASQFARAALGRSYFAETLDDALEAWFEAAGKGAAISVATPEGEVIDERGAITAGSGDAAAAGILARSRRIRELSAELKKATLEEERRLDASDGARMRVDDARRALSKLRDKTQEGRMAAMEKEKELSICKNEFFRLEERVKITGREIERLASERKKLADEKDALAEKLKSSAEAETAAQIELSKRQDKYYELLAKREELRKKLAADREEAARAGEKLEGISAAVGRVERERKEAEARLERLGREAESDMARMAELEREVKRLAEKGEADKVRLAALQADALRLEGELDDSRSAQNSLREEIKQARAAHDDVTSSLHQIEIELERSKGEFDYICEDAANRYQETLAATAGTIAATAEPPQDAEEIVVELKRKMDAVGPVNLMALSEFEEVAKRHDFLLTQKKDLEGAVDNLKRTIYEIDKTTKERFRQSFEEINESFMKLFPRLFGGGKAYLEMTNPDNLLQTGVDIIARPPGKKFQSVTLLSGGEKALTAVSLIFAIFLIKPAPFCILDEVDAPLDDANVGRVGDLIRELSTTSQFIVVTHNKRSMQTADILYGVTMQEPGISKIVSVDLRRDDERG